MDVAVSTPRPWTPDEDTLLRLAVAELGEEPGVWKTIALRIPGRTNKACRKRWLHSLSPTIIKTPWTPDEDAILLKLYNSHNPPRWCLIAKHIPGRTDDACSKRYREALDPLLKRDEWTPDEDARLVHLTQQFGTKWSQVGQAMGRSGLGCRNRWRLLQRKQRPRHGHRPSLASQPFANGSLYSPDNDPMSNNNLALDASTFGCSSSAPLGNAPFGDESNAPEPGPSRDQSLHSSPLNRLISDPLPGDISTSSSLSGALASSALQPSHRPSPPSARSSSPDPHYDAHCDVMPIEEPSYPTPPSAASPPHERTPSPVNISTPCVTSPPRPPNPDTHPTSQRRSPSPWEEADPPPHPPKRPRLRGSEDAAYDGPRLSSHLPATQDPTILPYACGAAVCWPGASGNGDARFATASEVAEHRRFNHPSHSPAEDGKLYRCALQGCGKGWRNINGIQYHLQVSKAHFRTALSQTGASSDSGVLSQSAARDSPAKTKPKKEHRCPHEGCTNTYKQRTGLQYHLAHGHPTVAQLEVLPPGLMRTIAVAPREAMVPEQE